MYDYYNLIWRILYNFIVVKRKKVLLVNKESWNAQVRKPSSEI